MRKLGVWAGLLAALAIGTTAPQPAHACGVKLAIKYSRPRRAVAAAGVPRNVLLVGSPPKRLQHDLSSAGHHVEVESSTSDAKKQNYDIVVVASNDQAEEARAKFPGAAVVVRSGDVAEDERSIESQSGREPIRVASAPTVINAGPDRNTVAGGPNKNPVEHKQDERPVNTRNQPTRVAAATPEPARPEVKPAPTPPPAPPEPTPPPTKPEQTEPDHEQVAASEPKPAETKPAKASKTSAALDQEVYFGTNSARLGNTRALVKALHWLKANPDINATVEGYADPTGSHDWNMTLSQHRAEAVRDWLVKKGIDSSRLEVTPYGDTKLKYGAHDGRNRRVAVEAQK